MDYVSSNPSTHTSSSSAASSSSSSSIPASVSSAAASIQSVSSAHSTATSLSSLSAAHIQPTQFRQVSAQEFHAAIVAGKKSGYTPGTENDRNSKWNGQMVHVYSVDEYNGMQLFLLPDKSAGFAIKNGNEIVSVFKNIEIYTLKESMLSIAIPEAIRNGGKRLDCFEPLLPTLYGRFGFRPVAKTKFDPKFAPEGWNYPRDKYQDIIFMIYDPTLESITKPDAVTARYQAQLACISYVSYDEGVAAQLAALKTDSA